MRDNLPRARALLCSSAVLALFCVNACQEPQEPILEPPLLEEDLEERTDLPPVSGGTLLITKDGERAIAADPDYDVVWIVNLVNATRERSIKLEHGDEPGRMVQGGGGLLHVALRSGGAIATIDPAEGAVLRRVPVCTWPRGLAYDPASDNLYVACAEGKLVTMSAESGDIVRTAELGVDLRDVVVSEGRLLVSRLKTAEVLSVDPYGTVISTARPPSIQVGAGDGTTIPFTPGVAWRMVPVASGGAFMVHQRGQDAPIKTKEKGGYGDSPCNSIVHGALTRFGLGTTGAVAAVNLSEPTRVPVSLPVDVAISDGGANIAVAGAGSRNAYVVPLADLTDSTELTCGGEVIPTGGMAVGVAFAGEDLVVQTRAPAAILVPGREITVQLGIGGSEKGHTLFHEAPAGAVACASCHPDGREDGHVWTFDPIGPRRSQSMRMRLSETLPLHWDGDMSDVGEIMDEVFVHRMSGAPQSDEAKAAIAAWIEQLPELPPLRDPADEAAARGEQIFRRDDVACAKCHAGPLLTNNSNEDVGKGNMLQVPSLIGVAWRAPFMHDGCAPTLRDRFDPACGGDKHGDVSMLSEAELDDLVAYLETL